MFKRQDMRNFLEKTLFEILSGYRLVAALAWHYGQPMKDANGKENEVVSMLVETVLKYTQQRFALEEADLDELKYELEKMLKDSKSMLEYILVDFMFYGGKYFCDERHDSPVNIQKYFEVLYPERMLAQARMISWYTEAFSNAAYTLDVFDLGCGPFTYFNMFLFANGLSLQSYTGIDKRDMSEYMTKLKSPMEVQRRFIKGELTCKTYFESMIKPAKGTACVAFLSEFLHCMSRKDQVVFLQNLVRTAPGINEVWILDVNQHSPMNNCFDFHMYLHCGGECVNYPELQMVLRDEGFDQAIVLNASNHHTMLRTAKHDISVRLV